MLSRAVLHLEGLADTVGRSVAEPASWSARDIFSFSGILIPWLAVAGVALSMSGLVLGLVDGAVPAATEAAKIGLIHLPAAWIATLLLLAMAFWALLGLVGESPICFLMAQALAPTGGMCAFLALWSGALWTKAVSGSWWAGSAHEIAEVMLLGVYIAIVATPALIEDVQRADRWSAIIAMFGASQVPFVYFLVEWVVTILKQPNALGLMKLGGGPGMLPMVLIAVGIWCHATLTGVVRLRCMIVERERGLRRLG